MSRCVSRLSAVALSLFAGALQAATLEVEVHGLASTEGLVHVALYDQSGQWLKKALRTASARPLAEGPTRLRFEDLPEGEYAFSLLHDANANGRMDTNAFGMPTEAYGFSNNAQGRFGPAAFEDARFRLAGDAVQRIQLR